MNGVAKARYINAEYKGSPFEGDHISITQVKTYLRCPLEYKFKYIDGLYMPQSGAVTLGKSMHRAIEQNYRQKIETKHDLPLRNMIEIFNEAYDYLLPETEFDSGENAEMLRREGMRLLSIYHAVISPNIQPEMVEQQFSIRLRGLDVPLVGIVDLVDENGIIIDHKTAKRSYNSQTVERDLQLSVYAMAYRALTKRRENGVRLDVMVRGRKPKIQRLAGKRSDNQLRRHANVIRKVREAIEKEIFYPNESYYCNICKYTKFCERW